MRPKRLLVRLLLLLCIGLLFPADVVRGQEKTFGAEANPTGSPIGGGEDYQAPVPRPEKTVRTAEELLAALQSASEGTVVYVEDGAVIDLTGRSDIRIPGGTVLASGRGRENSRGALIRTDTIKTMPLFRVDGPGTRITGLRLQGPDPERRTRQMRDLLKKGGKKAYYSIPNSRGIQTRHPDLEVDNCELSGWSHAAIFLRQGATGAHIHHNFIHHNQRLGLGYGVCLDRADALIEANRFDWCRHAIAGTGRPKTSYEARYNVVGKHANGHSFDMHGGADRGDGTDIAGDRIHIHHNTFRATSVWAFVLRGRPREKASVHHNWFLSPRKNRWVRQMNAKGNLDVGPNKVGPDGEIR